MSIHRVVPDIRSEDIGASRAFYGLLGFIEVMNLGWGVRRFFVRDPNGRVVNVVSHR